MFSIFDLSPFFLFWSIQYLLFCTGFNIEIKMANNIIAFYHAMISIILSGFMLYNHGIYFGKNNIYEELVALLSLSYFLVDLIYILIYDRNLLFLLHHILSITFISKSLIFGEGSNIIMVALFFGELTNPIRITEQMYYLTYPFESGKEKTCRKIYKVIFDSSFVLIRLFLMSAYAYYTYVIYFYKLKFIDQLFFCYPIYLALLGGYYWCYKIITRY